MTCQPVNTVHCLIHSLPPVSMPYYPCLNTGGSGVTHAASTMSEILDIYDIQRTEKKGKKKNECSAGHSEYCIAFSSLSNAKT